MKAWLKSFLEETPGVGSSTRLNALLITGAVLGVWIGMCLYKREFIHLGPCDLGALAAGLGAKLGNDICNK